MTATCPLATSVDLTGDDAEDEAAATQSPLLFVGTLVDPSPIVSATCHPATPDAILVDEEVAFKVIDQDTLRGFSDPFTEE